MKIVAGAPARMNTRLMNWTVVGWARCEHGGAVCYHGDCVLDRFQLSPEWEMLDWRIGMSLTKLFGLLGGLLLLVAGTSGAGELAPRGWSAVSPRDEVRPAFQWLSRGGPDGKGAFAIRADNRNGLIGRWQKTFAVEGGKFYRFSAVRHARNVDAIRRTGTARIIWQSETGGRVRHDKPSFASYRPGERPRAEPEFPADGETKNGWTEVSGTYLVPTSAARAIVELHFRWGEPNSSVEWAQVSLRKVDPPKPRRVRLATVHYRPQAGKTPKEKREQFAPLIARAAEKKVDLVVLPETLTYYGTGLKYADCAEPVPGPSTDYFGRLAKKNNW